MYLFHRRDWPPRVDPIPEETSADDSSWIYNIGIIGGTNRGSSGGSSGGGGGGGGRGGSSGSTGSSGSGSRGTTVSSGTGSTGLRGGSTLRSGGSSSSGRRIITSGYAGYATRGTIWSRSSPFGRSIRPSYAYIPLFGFWPIWWIYDYPDGATPNNNTRPGGSLISAAFTAPLNTTSTTRTPNLNTTYVIYGDTQSVQELIPKIIEGCNGINRTSGYDAAANTTMQLYREDSFALLGVNLNGTGRNTSFEVCVNNTIGYNLPVLDSGAGRAVSPASGLWALVGMMCYFVTKL